MRVLTISIVVLFITLSGCQSSTTKSEIKAVTPKIDVIEHKDEKSAAIQRIQTTTPEVALTFNGLADDKTMESLLAELDKFNIKATFFLPADRVAIEPDLVKEIINRGHEVQSGTLTFRDMTILNYDQTFQELYLANQVFEEHIGIKPNYVRSRSGDITDNMRFAAKALGMKGVIGSTINPRDRDMQSANEIVEYIERFINSGSIIHLNTYINPAIIDVIPQLNQLAEKKDYKITTLAEVLENQYIVKDLEEISGYDAVQINPDYKKEKPHIFYRKNTTKKEVALTFDDWASEKTVKEVLRILDHYKIKSTFFLIGKGVEQDPQLAKLIMDHGHEVASHSYRHLDVTKMKPKELQEDLVKTHQALTYALQEPPLLYFRPAQGIMDEETAKVITATGIETIAMYDIASFDWKLDYTAQDIYKRVMERMAPGKVIDMHILDHTKTVEALPLIIEQLLKEGYTFHKMSTWIEEDKEAKQ